MDGESGAESGVGAFVAALASAAPTPGGGAAAALAGALAAALAEMVGQLTAGRPRYAAAEPEVRRILTALAEARAELLRLVDEDAAAYGQVAAAYALPRADDAERAAREAAVQQALRAAMEPPRRVARLAVAVLRLTDEIAAVGNPSVASDAGCAAVLAEAAVRCAGLNVLANVALLRDRAAGAAPRQEQAILEAEAARLRGAALATVRARMGA